MRSPVTIPARRRPRPLLGRVYAISWRLAADGAPLSVIERSEMASTLAGCNGTRYRLLAYVVMDDHVEVVVEPLPPHGLEAIVVEWLSSTAAQMRSMGRGEPVWHAVFDTNVLVADDQLRERLAAIAAVPSRRWPGIEHYPWQWRDPDVAD